MREELLRMVKNLELNGDKETVLSSEKLATIIKVALKLNDELETHRNVTTVDFTHSDGINVLSAQEFLKRDISGDVKIDAGDLKYLLRSNATMKQTMVSLNTKIGKLQTKVNDTHEMIGLAYSIKECQKDNFLKSNSAVDMALELIGKELDTTA